MTGAVDSNDGDGGGGGDKGYIGGLGLFVGWFH